MNTRTERTFQAPSGAIMTLDPTDSFTDKNKYELYELMGKTSIVISGGFNDAPTMKGRVDALYEEQGDIGDCWSIKGTVTSDGTYSHPYAPKDYKPVAKVEHEGETGYVYEEGIIAVPDENGDWISTQMHVEQ